MGVHRLVTIVTAGAVLGAVCIVAPAVAVDQRSTTSAALEIAGVWNEPWTPPAAADGAPVEEPNAPDEPWASRGQALEPKSSTSRSSVQGLAPASAVAAPGLGALPYFGFDETPLSLDVVARVNLGNGNLLLSASDGVLNGAGIALRNDRSYNGLSAASGSFGGKWISSLSQADVGLEVVGDQATYRGPSGFLATFTKSGSEWVAPAGFNAQLVEDASSTDERYTITYNQSGEEVAFSTAGYITGNTDRNGVGSAYSYNPHGQLATIFTASGRNYTITWESPFSSTISTITDSAGRQTTYDRDGAGQLSTVTRADGLQESYTYDAAGRIATIVLVGSQGAATDQIVTFGYDGADRVTSISRAAGGAPDEALGTTAYSYASGLTTVTDGRGNTAEYVIDSSGRVESAKDALGRVRSQTWTANSDVATTTDAFASASTPGNITTYAYDQLNNVTGVSYPTGAAAAATYSQGTTCPGAGSGNPHQPKCVSDDAGNSKSFEYDELGNLRGVTDATASGTGAQTESYTYEEDDRSICGGFQGQVCSATNAIGGVTSYAYDASGNLTTVTQPAPLGITVYTYDSLGRVATVRDGNNAVTAYSYNVRDDVVRTTFSGGQSLTTEYNPAGLVSKEVDSLAGAKEYTYDALGRLLSQVGPAGANQTYTYDLTGNTTSYTDQLGTVTYTWDAVNQLVQLTEPGGTCAAGAAAPAASSGCVKFTYDANGSETKRTFPGGATVSTTRDPSARPTRITAQDAHGDSVVDVGYSYGAAGSTAPSADRMSVQRRTSYQEVGVPAGAFTDYTYDSLQRLVSAVEVDGTSTSASWTYTYDDAGNRTSHTRAGSTGAEAGTTTYTYNSANQLTSSTADTTAWIYDGAGNQLTNGITGQNAAYNVRHAVTSIGSSDYTAFGQGNLETLNRSAQSTSYARSSLGLMAESTSTQTTAFTRTPSGPVVSTRIAAGGGLYYVQDHLGSVVGAFDGIGAFIGGYSYSPFGEPRFKTDNALVSANPLRYINSYYDSSADMYRLDARYYDPATGRFSQMDPSGQERAPYLYAAGNPILLIDPSGTKTRCSSTGSNTLAVLGGVSFIAGFFSFGAGFGAAAALGASTGGASVIGSIGCAINR